MHEEVHSLIVQCYWYCQGYLLVTVIGLSYLCLFFNRFRFSLIIMMMIILVSSSNSVISNTCVVVVVVCVLVSLVKCVFNSLIVLVKAVLYPCSHHFLTAYIIRISIDSLTTVLYYYQQVLAFLQQLLYTTELPCSVVFDPYIMIHMHQKILGVLL